MEISRKEIKRQIFHLFLGIFLVILLHYNLLNKISFFIIVTIAVFICFISKKMKIPGVYWFFKNFERDIDIIHFPGRGALLFLTGAFIVVLLFPKDIAMASILILALGDSVSHLVGKFGGIRHPFNDKKFLEGSLAGTIIAFIGAVLILNNSIEAALGAITAMVAEGFNIEFGKKKIDDNLIIPLISAASIWVIRLFL
ncbi:MAG: hypothetical protein ABIJ08_07060 [Nanoarchaeota archaeon]